MPKPKPNAAVTEARLRAHVIGEVMAFFNETGLAQDLLDAQAIALDLSEKVVDALKRSDMISYKVDKS